MWRALSETSGKNVSNFMHNWTAAPGYPVIKVSRGDENGQLFITQERFLSSALSRQSEGQNSETLWNIPVYIGSNSVRILVLFFI